MEKQLTHVIVFVSDMQRSIQFYSEVLGLALRFQSPKWTEFDAAGIVLALHHAQPAGSDKPAAPATATAGRCQFGLTVPSLDDFHRRMLAGGVPCIQPPKREQFGALAAYADPDGLPFSVWEEADKKTWDQSKESRPEGR